jgi:4-aminobutyrate aminotransferase-like enzyme
MMMDASGMVNSFDSAGSDSLEPGLRDLVKRREAVLGSGYRLFYDRPVRFTRAAGVHLYDEDGEEYLDAYNNVPAVGHCHPRVVAAIAQQAATLNVHTRYLTAGVVDYAERLLATHAEGLDRAMFTCTGSEANDLALRIARHATGAAGVIVTANAYHGVTAAVAEASPSLGPNVPAGPHVACVPAPDPALGDATGAVFAGHVAAAIADLRSRGAGVAAFLADSLLSSDGVLPDPAGLLRPAHDLVHEAGGLYIADEVQSGFGRTGSHMWGYQRHGLAPDIVTMGKPMGNGMPIAGLVARHSVLEDFGREVRYFNTFGGNPVCIAAASAVLDVIEDEGLRASAAATGAYLQERLAHLADGSGLLRGVRGVGLYFGIDVADPETGAPSSAQAARIVNDMRDRRILISATGPAGNVLKVRPPLPFNTRDADVLLGALAGVVTGQD